MKTITKIEPAAARPSKAKTRVAAYCRVSTGMDDQLVSLETQKSHYEDLIGSNPDWVFAGLYYDEGMVRRLIERITVYEDHLDFEFKSGLETEVQM